jgi:hypothetical protein
MTIVTLQASQAVRDAVTVALTATVSPDDAAHEIASYARPESIDLALARVRRALDARRGAVGAQAEHILVTAAALVA